MKRTFDQLIDCPCGDGGSESTRYSGGTIKDAVFQLINHHQNLDGLLQEAGDLSKERTKEARSAIREEQPHHLHSVDAFITMLDVQASGSDLPTVAALECARRVNDLSKQKMGAQNHMGINVVIKAVKHLKLQHKFNDDIFINQLCSSGDGINAELLWLLNKEFIMSIDSYISSNLGKPVMFKALPGNILNMSKSITGPERNKIDIVADMMAYLIRQGYSPKSSDLDQATKNRKKVSIVILDSVLKGVLKNVTELITPDQNPFYLAFKHGGLDAETMKRCCTHLLAVTLSLNPDLKVSQALMQQSRWKYANMPAALVQMYKHLMLVFNAKEVLNIIRRVLTRQEVNWETVLSFAATYLILFKDASVVYRGLIKELLEEAFEELEVENLIMGFLLARQGCFEGPHVFPSYQEWFQESFGNSSSPANNKKAFSLLMKFLSDIVPFESANFLRAHVLKAPFIPSKCNVMYNDYTLLAKTRLSDLKEPLDPQVGIYINTKSDVQVEDQISNDVRNALASFEQTGKVPTIIIEASIFRKPYYIKQFLPALMKPRHLPDVPDNRMKFIAALDQSGKIPSAMLNDYDTKCKHEVDVLMDGVFVDEDEEVILMAPEDQLQAMLCQLLETVSKELTETDRKDSDIPGKLSLIKDRVDEILGEDSKKVTKDLEPIVIGDKYELSPKTCQVSEMLLNNFCKLAALLSTATHIKDSWYKCFVEVMISRSRIVSHLYQRIWNLVIIEGTKLEQHHIIGLAHLLAVLGTLTSKTPKVVSPAEQKIHFHEAVLQALPYITKEWMIFNFRFMTYYLQYSHCEVRLSTDIKKSCLQKFQIIANRLCPGHLPYTSLEPSSLPVLEEQQLATEIMRSENYCKLSKEFGSMTFDNWLALECNIIPEQDLFSDMDRIALYDLLFYTRFLPQPIKEGGCGGCYREACIKTFCAVIRYQMTPTATQKSCSKHPTGENERSCHHIVRFLQNICLNPTPDKAGATSTQREHHATTSWVVEATNKLISEFTENVVPVCFRLYSQLPPQLFWTNDVRITPNEEMVKTSTSHIKQYLRNHLSDGLCLTYPCLLYLLKGALSFNSPQIGKLMCGSLKDNMFIHLAILIHWDKLQWLENHFHCGNFSCHGIKKSQMKLQLFDSVELPTAVEMLNPLETFACYSIMRNGGYSSRHIHRALMPLACFPAVINCLLCTAMSDLPLQASQDPEWLNIQEGLRLLVCHHPRYLLGFVKHMSAPVHYVPELSARLRPVSFLKMMSATPENDLKLLLKEDDTMMSLLSVYTKITELYDSETEESSLSYYQPLTANDIISLSRFLKKCLQLCPREKLAKIPNIKSQISNLSSIFIK